MSDSRSDLHQRASEVFLSARRLSGEARQRFLDSACAGDEQLRHEVQTLLAHGDSASGFLESQTSVERAAASLIESLDPKRSLPDRIGRYRILDMLGEGGMGVVYRAQQDQPRRIVALKVLRPGFLSAGALKRFEQESQALGRLHHHGIAQIHEAGTFDAGSGEQPFFAMELIDGPSLLEYVQTKKPGTRERLEIVIHICEAVDHAHRMGVIHRDLKPSNILVVEEGASPDADANATRFSQNIARPKILDFGVARITDSDVQVTTVHTDVGQLLGTLTYMSPEQVAADPTGLDPRSDVYALGVITYELLAGRPPLDVVGKVIHEAVRAIREDDPAPLSSVNRVFRGDLETIVRKALEKDKERRYASAAALAEDLRRYLRDEPITARPPSAMYQMSKFASRHKTLVAAAAAIFLALILGIAGTSFGLWRARQNLAVAQSESAKVSAVSNFLQSMLVSVDPQHDGPNVKVREVLDQAARDLESTLIEFPEVNATLRHTIGMTYLGLGMANEAEAHLAAALAWWEQTHGERHAQTLRLRSDHAQSLIAQGRFRQARPILRETLALQSGARPEADDDPDRLLTMERLAIVLQELGEMDESESLHRQVLRLNRRILGEHDAKTIRSMGQLAALLTTRGKYDEALPLLERSVELSRDHLGITHPSSLAETNNLAVLFHEMGRLDEATALLEQAHRDFQERLGPDHARTLVLEDNLAQMLARRGRYEEAEVLFQSVIERSRRVLGPDHPVMWLSKNNLATMYVNTARHHEAEGLLREAVHHLSEHRGERHDHTLTARANLAEALMQQKKLDEAETLTVDIMALFEEVYGPDHHKTLTVMNNHGLLLLHLERPQDAEPIFVDLLERQERLFGEESHLYGTILSNLANALRLQEKYDDASVLTDRLLELRRRTLGPHHAETILAVYHAGVDRRDTGRHDEALEYLTEALDLIAQTDGVEVYRWIFLIAYGHTLMELGRYDDAEAALLETIPVLEQIFGKAHPYTLRAARRLSLLYEEMGREEEAAEWRSRAEPAPANGSGSDSDGESRGEGSS